MNRQIGRLFAPLQGWAAGTKNPGAALLPGKSCCPQVRLHSFRWVTATIDVATIVASQAAPMPRHGLKRRVTGWSATRIERMMSAGSAFSRSASTHSTKTHS